MAVLFERQLLVAAVFVNMAAHLLRTKTGSIVCIRACMRTCFDVQRKRVMKTRDRPKRIPLPVCARTGSFAARYDALGVDVVVGRRVRMRPKITGFPAIFFFSVGGVMPSPQFFLSSFDKSKHTHAPPSTGVPVLDGRHTTHLAQARHGHRVSPCHHRAHREGIRLL